MKTLAGLAFLAASTLAQSVPRTVYVLPMAGGLDQYLAQKLTSEHVMRVVADPKLADVLLTDRLDEAFERKMTELRAGDDKSDAKNDDTRTHSAFHSSKGKGTIFLVDAKSREVLWSDYEKPAASSSSNNLNREAERIAKKLQTSGK